MKTLLGVTAALVAAVAVLVAVTLPPKRIALMPGRDGTIAGIVHVHSNRSDGSSSPDEIAAAAARAGVKFLVFTDHGDATRTPDPPVYRSGVLCLDGVEISTSGGHYIALDMPAAPYPLAGEARDVVEDVKRLGGFGIVAHPDSPKPQLRWTEWTAPFDAIELLNPDTSWRILAQQPRWRERSQLFAALVDYPFRAPETMANLLQPSGSVYSWLALAERRRVVAIAGLDAHARINMRGDPGEAKGWMLPIPGYEPAFRMLSIHVAIDRDLTGNAATDGSVVMRGIRGGHLYTVVDGLASPPAFDFTATNEFGTVHEGDQLSAGSAVALRIRSNAPARYTTLVHEGTKVIAQATDPQDMTVHGGAQPAVYWVEIVSNGPRPITWLRSNPIYVRGTAALTQAATRLPPKQFVPLFSGSIDSWRTEHDPTSVTAAEVINGTTGKEMQFRFGLAGGPPAGQVAALVVDTPKGVPDATRLAVSMRAERPMRVSVQLRGGAGGSERWERSVFVDRFESEKTIYFDELTPVGNTQSWKPPLDAIRSVMFVVDTTNAKPGTSAKLWIKKAELQR
ncbi:MAG TPA: hypothetical protein VFA59_25630 [Vicinamibacterales bacterium]|nr:hypothetical protein [Vicinamibacterales bacterium]